jgi:hypothetical protein
LKEKTCGEEEDQFLEKKELFLKKLGSDLNDH